MTQRLFEGPPVLGPDQATFSGQVVSATREDGRVAVVLDRTQFYPNAGGQPCDLGHLCGLSVVEVSERGESIVHWLEDDEAAAWTEGQELEGAIDPVRRRDHMEQHSGQHLLSAILESRGIPTLSFHLGAETSTIDIEADTLSSNLIAAVEAEANGAIRDVLPVTATVHMGDAIAAVVEGLRKPPEGPALSSPRGLRIVQFGHDDAPIDRDPCCGTHVTCTAQLGALVILGTERGRKGETRVQFVVGGRSTAAVRTRLNALRAAGEVLTSGFAELPERGRKLLAQTKELRRELKQVRGRLVELEAASFAAASDSDVLVHVLEEGDAKSAGPFARACLAARPTARAAVIHKGERLTLVVARGAQAAELDAGATLRAVLGPFGGKGGGTPAFAQGAISDVSQCGALMAAIRAALA